MKTFKVGDVVRWRSQAGGCWLTKRGVVVEVVPAGGEDPRFGMNLRLTKIERIFGIRPMKTHTFGGGMARKHVSYIVLNLDNQQLYWPRVSALVTTGQKMRMKPARKTFGARV